MPVQDKTLQANWVVVRPATYDMGAMAHELQSDILSPHEETPRHRVRVTRAFNMMTTPLTRAHWRSLMGNDPSEFADLSPDTPVECVSWYDAIACCNALSRREGFRPAYVLDGERGTPGEPGYRFTRLEFMGLDSEGYRLPVEAEWELAARAGTNGPMYGGSPDFDRPPAYIHGYESEYAAILRELGWFCDNSGRQPHAVGGKQPNDWGLHDMLGNVDEWCFDRFAPYPASPEADPFACPRFDAADNMVRRGGNYTSRADEARVAWRDAAPPATRQPQTGFRVVRSLVCEHEAIAEPLDRRQDWIHIPAGRFMQNDWTELAMAQEPPTFDDLDRHLLADSPHPFPTSLPTPLWVKRTGVTVAEWVDLMPTAQGAKASGEAVRDITFIDAATYCNALSRREGLPLAYRIEQATDPTGVSLTDPTPLGYRLPSITEFEYLATGGLGVLEYQRRFPDVLALATINNPAAMPRSAHAADKDCLAINPWGLHQIEAFSSVMCWGTAPSPTASLFVDSLTFTQGRFSEALCLTSYDCPFVYESRPADFKSPSLGFYPVRTIVKDA